MQLLDGPFRTQFDQNHQAFLHLNDGSTFDSIQIVVGEGLANRDEVLKQITGAAVSVLGAIEFLLRPKSERYTWSG